MATNKQLFSIQKYLSSSAVDKFRLERVFEVNKAKTPQLYNDIINDVQFLENNGLFILIDGADVQVKYANGIKVWSDAQTLGGGGSGIQEANIDANGDLIITLSDGSVKNAGNAKGDPLPYSDWSAEDVDKLIEDVSIDDQRVPAITAGVLPTPPHPNMYMVVTGVGAYTYGGTTIGTNADGYQTTFWWNGTAWSNNGSVKVKGDKGIDGKTIELYDPAKVGGYASGSQIFFNNSVYETIVDVPMGESPTTNPAKFVARWDSSLFLQKEEVEGRDSFLLTDSTGNILLRFDSKGRLITQYKPQTIPTDSIEGLDPILSTLVERTTPIGFADIAQAKQALTILEDAVLNTICRIRKDGSFVTQRILTEKLEVLGEIITPAIQVTTATEFYVASDVKFLNLKVIGVLPTDATEARTPTNVTIVLNDGISDLVAFNASMSIQGSGSATLIKKGYNIDMTNADGKAFKLKLWDMIPTDSMHIKAFHTDITHVRDVGNSRLWYEMYKSRPYPYNHIKAMPSASVFPTVYNEKTQYTADAKFYADGVPCQILMGGNTFEGLYTLRLKKTRENYAIDNSNENHIFFENAVTGAFLGSESYADYTAWLAKWELRSPKTATLTTQTNVMRFFNWWGSVYNGTTDLATTYQDYINLYSWIDFYIEAELIDHLDIAGNNTLIMSQDGSHFDIFLYDTDNTIGIYSTLNPPLLSLHVNVDIWTKFRTAFLSQIKARYKYLRDSGVLTNENFKNIYGGISKYIPREVYKKNYEKWGGATANGIPTMDQIYAFLAVKLNYLDSIWID